MDVEMWEGDVKKGDEGHDSEEEDENAMIKAALDLHSSSNLSTLCV